MSDTSDVLIADDDEGICFSLARAVRSRGLTPRVAADGPTAVEVVRNLRGRIRAAFLDERLPRLGGAEVLAELRTLAPEISCCVMTTFRGGAVCSDGVPLLEKPFELAAFFSLLDAMLRPRPPARMRVALAFPPRYALSADVIRGVFHYVRTGRDWLVSVYHEEDIGIALREQPDGLIAMVWSADAAKQVREWGGPVVDTGPSFPKGRFARVGLADAAVGVVAAEHLLGLGPRRMAVISHPGIPATEVFKDGFVRRLAVDGVECVVPAADRFDWPTPTSSPPVHDLAQWVAELGAPAAVFATTDPLALRVGVACRAAGLRVPEDVAVLGAMNDAPLCESFDPPLSSVRVAGEAVGCEAARVLEHLLAGDPPPASRIEIAPVGVAVRRSTDPAAVADPALAAALRFLRERYADRIGVNDVVEAVAVSRSSLERRFRAMLGHGPLAELVRLRIDRARQLLVETDRPLGEVASACGFRDARHLAVTFRRRVGTTPTTYRNRHRGP